MTPEQTLEWLAQQHFDQCCEERPIQDWIRKMKSQLPEQQEPVFSFQMELHAPAGALIHPYPHIVGTPDLKSLFGKVGDRVTFYTTPPYVPTERQRKPLTYGQRFEIIKTWKENYASQINAAEMLIALTEAAHGIVGDTHE